MTIKITLADPKYCDDCPCFSAGELDQCQIYGEDRTFANYPTDLRMPRPGKCVEEHGV